MCKKPVHFAGSYLCQGYRHRNYHVIVPYPVPFFFHLFLLTFFFTCNNSFRFNYIFTFHDNPSWSVNPVLEISSSYILFDLTSFKSIPIAFASYNIVCIIVTLQPNFAGYTYHNTYNVIYYDYTCALYNKLFTIHNFVSPGGIFPKAWPRI